MANLDNILQLLTEERDKLNSAIAALSSLNGSPATTTRTAGRTITGGKRVVSAVSRRRMAAAQKARWAKTKGQKVVPISSKKRRISAAGIARIRAATKARWARVRAAKK